MKTFLELSIFLTSFCLALTTVQAQIVIDTKLNDLPENTKITIKEPFKIIGGKTSVLLDDGKGKICSCQFFASEAKEETQLYNTEHLFSLRKITIKGLFDGSQMHVARIYFKNTSNYFKLKCYTRDLLVEHISEYLNVGRVNSINREN